MSYVVPTSTAKAVYVVNDTITIDTISGAIESRQYVWDTVSLAWVKSEVTNGAVAATINNFPSIYPVSDNGGSITIDSVQLPGALTGSGNFKVSLNESSITLPVSIASFPLPTGAATEATLSALNSKVTVVSTRILVDGSGVTQPVSATSLPLPTGAATEATLSSLNSKVSLSGSNILVDGSSVTQPVSGTVTANQGGSWSVAVNNAAGASAVNIQDGGNSITVDGSVSVSNFPATQAISAVSLPLPTGAATQATLATLLLDATFTGRINTLGQKTSANSTPIVIASDQSTLTVSVSNFPATQPISGTVTANAGTGTFVVGDGGSSLTTDSPQLPASLVGGKLDTTISQNVVGSTSNNSTANLGSGATFTGAGESTLNVAGIQVNIKADQQVTIKVQQSIDGTNWDIEDTFVVPASTGYSTTVQATASFFRVLVTNNGGSSTTFLRLQTALCPMVEALPRSLINIGRQSYLASTITQHILLSQSNNTTTPLGGSGVYTGTAETTLGVAALQVNVFSNVGSIVNGLSVQQSVDGTNWDVTDNFTVYAGVGFATTVQAVGAFFRVVYTNGSSAQASFRLTSVLCPIVEAVPRSLGQKLSQGSLAVVMASDQPSIPVTTAPVGSVSGLSFGDVALSATTIAAVRRTAYTEQTTNFTGSVVSSSASDAAAGTGARTVKITYLDSTGVGPLTETVTLNGTTAVNLVSTNHCYIEKMEVLTVGSTGSNVGTITLKTGAGGAGTTVGTIAATDLSTFWNHHYVPLGKTCYIISYFMGNTGTTASQGSLYVLKSIQINVSNVPERIVSDFVRLFGQDSSITRIFSIPVLVVGPSRVTSYAIPESGASVTYRSSFDFYDQ